MRFTVTIPNEPPQQFSRRSQALAYIHDRQQAETLPDSAKIIDGKTGTVLKIPPAAEQRPTADVSKNSS